MTRIGHRRGIPWSTEPKYIAPTPENITSGPYIGRHADGTAHRLTGCRCGHEGRLGQYTTIMGDEWSDEDYCLVCGGDHDRISREDSPDCYDAWHAEENGS